MGAGLAQIPGSDAPILITIQTGMIVLLGEIYGRSLTKEAALSILAGFGAEMTGRSVSQFLIGWIPGYGNAVNACTAFAVTEAIGFAAMAYLKDESEK